MHSLSVEWSDSDSSIDSLPSSDEEQQDEENELDWPEERGFQVSGFFYSVVLLYV